MLKSLGVYLAVWLVTIATFWFFTSQTDGLGFSLVYLWGILPTTTFGCSVAIGSEKTKYKWLFCVVLGVFYMLAEYFTFSLANNLEFNKINAPEYPMILIGGAVSLAGLVVGHLWRKYGKES